MPPSLAEGLKSQTSALHTALERGALMSVLLRGEMAREPYCALLRNLHVLYDELEPALELHAAHPAVAPVVFPVLFRRHALADDLTELHGPDWADDLPTAAAASRYALHLRDVAAHQPQLLVAHAYVRYLGDLSGGQILRRIVMQALGLHGASGTLATPGTRFYDFGTPADVAVQVRAFRAGLAQLPADGDPAAAVIAEAVSAFRRHQELFDELAGTPSAAPHAPASGPAREPVNGPAAASLTPAARAAR